uniref:E3 ubiquitin-protein ligase Topors n=1 Tax=Petromyzon marinus TaxID=7757 RepID=A0AAJ7T165_PETMA|nr:E3 ubiquitin-protein ligase Topors isoform X2 [Petromyzon marinus]
MSVRRPAEMEARDSVEETDSSSPDAGRRRNSCNSSSPDSKCAICLDRMDNRALASSCMHSFCFLCILEWAKNKADCPLCKQPFRSIIYNVRSNSSFDEYWLTPEENGSFSSPDGRRFRYRSTLTHERLRAERREESGVLFEAASRRQPPSRVDAHIQRMLQQLRERRRARLNNRSLRCLKEEEVMAFRRALYRRGVRVRRVEDGGRHRTVSPDFFLQNPATLHRLVPWLKRELTVLFGRRESIVSFVLHRILENITRFHLESDAFLQDLKPTLQYRTEHFLHEFASFARSPFNMEAYDERAFYDAVVPGDGDGAESSESSVIAISPDPADDPPSVRTLCLLKSPSSLPSPPGLSEWDDETPGPSYASREEAVPDGSPETPERRCWSRRGVAGTYASATPSSSARSRESDEDGNVTPFVAVTAAASQEVLPDVKMQKPCPPPDSGDSDLDDCVIVGYVKPLAERTPELVMLSSDSGDDEEAAAPGTSGMDDPGGAAAAVAKEAPTSRPLDRKYPPAPPSISLCETEVDRDSDRTQWLSDSSVSSRRRTTTTRSRRRRRRSAEKPKCGTSSRSDAAQPREVSSRRENSRSGSREPRSSRRSKQKHRQSREVSVDIFEDWDRNVSHSRKSRDEDDRRDWDRSRGYRDRSRSRDKAHGRLYGSDWSSDSERSVGRGRFSEQGRSRNQRERSRDRHRDKTHKRGQESSWASERHRGHRASAARERSWSDERTRAREDRAAEDHRHHGGRSEKPGGKRKCKTHHIEHAYYLSYSSGAREHREPASASHSPERYRGHYRNAPSQALELAPGPSHHKACAVPHGRVKRSRSSSVEIVFEGKLTIDAEHFRKSRRKRKKSKHKRRH